MSTISKPRALLDAAAEGIAHEAAEADVISEALVPFSPEGDEDNNQRLPEEAESQREWKRRKVTKTIELARKHAFPVFDSGRADNRTYDDKAILEMVARICNG